MQQDAMPSQPEYFIRHCLQWAAQSSAEHFQQERHRWILWIPVALGIGIWLYFALPTEPSPYLGMMALALLLAIRTALRRFHREQKILFCLVVFLMLSAGGFTAAQWERVRMDVTPLSYPTGVLEVSGVIREIIDTDQAMKIVLSQVEAEDPTSRHRHSIPHTLRLSLRNPDPSLKIGQLIRLRAGLFPLPEPALPGGFDFSRHFYFQGIGAVGFALQPVDILRETTHSTSTELLRELRLFMAREIRRIIDDPYSGPVAAALITGDRATIAPEVKDAMRGAGLAHMLAISGLHLGLVAGILFLFFRYALLMVPGWGLRYPLKKWAAALAMLGSLGYLALAGFPVSAQRAYVMVALFLGAVMLDRQVMPMRSVALAAILILLIKPSMLLSPSFQLSFAATIAIISMVETLMGKYRASPALRQSLLYKPLLYFGGIMLTSLAASLATTPFIIFHFNQFTLWDVLGNLGASAILSLWVMPFAVLAMILLPLGLGALPLWCMDLGIQGILSIAFWVSSLPHALHYVPTLPEGGMALIILGGCWFCFWLRRWRWLGAPLIVAGFASLLTVSPPDILLSRHAEQVALRDATSGQYHMVQGSSRNFRARMWQEALGIEAWHATAAWTPLRCDALGCIVHTVSHRIALPHSPTALAEDCTNADIIISEFFHDCNSPDLSIERPASAAAIWLEQEAVTVNHTRSFAQRLQQKD